MNPNMINKASIKEFAESIALEYSEKATPLEEIVKDEGLKVFYDDYGSNTFDGMTIYGNNKFSIHMNTRQGNTPNSAKGRFTLAHELGHYYIDSHRIGLKKGLLKPHQSKTNQKQFFKIEREADYFASNLLMPQERFDRDIFRQNFSIELIDHLKDEYKVSRTACAFRFSDIGNHPIMIIYAEAKKIKWFHCSADFKYKYLLFGKKVPSNTVMGEYFQDIKDDVFKTEEVWAIDIFKYVKEEDVEEKFFEHCIPFNNRALSILWGN